MHLFEFGIHSNHRLYYFNLEFVNRGGFLMLFLWSCWHLFQIRAMVGYYFFWGSLGISRTHYPWPDSTLFSFKCQNLHQLLKGSSPLLWISLIWLNLFQFLYVFQYLLRKFTKFNIWPPPILIKIEKFDES